MSADAPNPLARRAMHRARSARWLLALVYATTCPVSAGAQDARPTMFVFVQVDVKSSALEQALQKQLPGLALTVFGRFRDFQDGVATKNPDAVLAITPLLDLIHVKPTLQGMHGAKDSEPYLLVTPGSTPKTPLIGTTIGIVDLLGRDGTQAFAVAALGTEDIKIKLVAKIEDLLPLLKFAAADAVLIPSSAVKRFTERARLAMTVRALPNAHVGLPSVAVRNDKTRQAVIQAIHKLGADTMSLLGIDNWSAR